MLSLIRQKLAGYKPQRIDCAADIKASVVVPVYEKDGEVYILLEKRTDRMSAHPGEVSFPGGMYEEVDVDSRQTAVRECCEEIGVSLSDVEIVGELDDVKTLSGFVISPYVGILPYPFEFRLNEAEVAYLIYLPFSYLAQSSPSMERAEVAGRVNQVPAVYYQGERIWGATCRILLKLKGIVEDEHI